MNDYFMISSTVIMCRSVSSVCIVFADAELKTSSLFIYLVDKNVPVRTPIMDNDDTASKLTEVLKISKETAFDIIEQAKKDIKIPSTASVIEKNEKVEE